MFERPQVPNGTAKRESTPQGAITPPSGLSRLIDGAQEAFKRFIDRDYRDERQRSGMHAQFSDLRALAEDRTEGLHTRLSEISKALEEVAREASQASQGRRVVIEERILRLHGEYESVSKQYARANEELCLVQGLIWKLEEVARRPAITGAELDRIVSFISTQTEKARVAGDVIDVTRERIKDLGLEVNEQGAADKSRRAAEIIEKFSTPSAAPAAADSSGAKLSLLQQRLKEKGLA